MLIDLSILLQSLGVCISVCIDDSLSVLPLHIPLAPAQSVEVTVPGGGEDALNEPRFAEPAAQTRWVE
jgi:hypothetical protein